MNDIKVDGICWPEPKLMWDKNFWNTTWVRSYNRYNRHHKDIWGAVVPFIRGKVLDLGCGPCVIYKDLDVDLTGVDFSEEAINQAKINYPKGKYLVSDALKTNLPSGEFDTILMLGLLDYYPDWTEIIAEVKRLVKPNGKIFATLLDGFDGHNWKNYKHITSNWYLYEIQ